MRILIVEDEPTMRALLKTVWEKVPEITELEEASNVWDARLAIDRRRPDAILLDWLIPGGDSLELLRELAAAGHVVFLTSASSPPSSGVPSEAAAWLTKPTWSDLTGAIQRAAEVLRGVHQPIKRG